MWSSDLKARVYTRVKAEAEPKLIGQYPNITFTTSEQTPADPAFPTVLIRRMEGSEAGRTTESYDLCAVWASYQIDVIDNESNSNAETVMDAVCDAMKCLGFELIGDIYSTGQSVGEYRCITRHRRLISEMEMEEI